MSSEAMQWEDMVIFEGHVNLTTGNAKWCCVGALIIWHFFPNQRSDQETIDDVWHDMFMKIALDFPRSFFVLNSRLNAVIFFMKRKGL